MENRESWEGVYPLFEKSPISELEIMLASAESREEKLLWRTLINLKLQLKQESIVGETLV
jgi:hypothetical protein